MVLSFEFPAAAEPTRWRALRVFLDFHLTAANDVCVATNSSALVAKTALILIKRPNSISDIF
jgi:hypothetical protein